MAATCCSSSDNTGFRGVRTDPRQGENMASHYITDMRWHNRMSQIMRMNSVAAFDAMFSTLRLLITQRRNTMTVTSVRAQD